MANSGTGNVTELELPVERGCPFAAPEGYARLREQAPINRAHLVNGPDVWVISGHEESRAVSPTAASPPTGPTTTSRWSTPIRGRDNGSAPNRRG
jgi:hypothetical protein